MLVGAVGLGCSFGATIGVSVCCSSGGDGSYCFGDVLVLKM